MENLSLYTNSLIFSKIINASIIFSNSLEKSVIIKAYILSKEIHIIVSEELI